MKDCPVCGNKYEKECECGYVEENNLASMSTYIAGGGTSAPEVEFLNIISTYMKKRDFEDITEKILKAVHNEMPNKVYAINYLKSILDLKTEDQIKKAIEELEKE